MSLEELVSRYIESTDYALKDLECERQPISIRVEQIREVVKHVRTYLDDARYYRDKGRLEVSLTSVAYAEGILDALKLLGAVKFEWPTRRKENAEK